MEDKIRKMVHKYYWDRDVNCARTMLGCLSRLYDVRLLPQTMKAAIGLHGAGGYRAQCGLVEGSLMFIGIYFSEKRYSDKNQFADEFMKYFESLKCYDLRPNGFTENDPPHACEELTVKAINFTYEFIKWTAAEEAQI
jgi:hypothetical protein